MIVDVIKKILRDNPVNSGPLGLSRLTESLNVNSLASLNYYDTKFHVVEFRFFDLYFDDKLITTDIYIAYILKNTYFQNI